MTSFRRRWWSAIILSVFAGVATPRTGHAATIKFDQSQTGDYNLQIHLKNIELYAVFDDTAAGGDEDYGELPDYTDPSNLGPSKPPNPPSSPTPLAPSPQESSSSHSTTTAAPAAATVTSSAPSAAASVSDLFGPANSEKIVQMVEALIANNGGGGNGSAAAPGGNAYEFSSPATTAATTTTTSTTSTADAATVAPAGNPQSNTSNRKCGPGYFRDPLGRCRRIRKPHLPFLQMVHTPGVIKSFQPQLLRQSDESNAATESIN